MVIYRFCLQPVKDNNADASERDGPTGKGVRCSRGWVSKGDDNQMFDVITSVTFLRFGISCKFSMQA